MTLTKYKALLHEREIIEKKVSKARAKLAAKCKHPAEFVRDTSSQRSNGYGSCHEHKYRLCQICFMEEHWGNGRWFKPQPSRSDD